MIRFFIHENIQENLQLGVKVIPIADGLRAAFCLVALVSRFSKRPVHYVAKLQERGPVAVPGLIDEIEQLVFARRASIGDLAEIVISKFAIEEQFNEHPRSRYCGSIELADSTPSCEHVCKMRIALLARRPNTDLTQFRPTVMHR